jgi:O-antigen/teichoic acid export membrane protein
VTPTVRVRRNVFANYIGQTWTTLVGIVFLPLYLHFLGVEAFGLIGVFVVLQTWLSVLDFGLTPTISREMARFTAGARDAQSIRDLLRSIELVALGLAASIIILVGLSAAWIASRWLQVEHLPLPDVVDALKIMAVVVGLRLVSGIYRSALVGLQRQVAANLVTSLVATVRALGAVIVLATISPSLEAFFLWQGAVSAIGLVTLGAVVHRSLPRALRRSGFSLRPLTGVARFAGGSVAITLLGFMLSQSDKIILSRLVSLSHFAIYSLAYTVASGVRLVAQPINIAVFPRLTELLASGDQEALSSLYHKASQATAVLMGSVGLVLLMFGNEIMTLWTRDPDIAEETSTFLGVLVIGMMLNAFMNGPYFLQLAAGWTGLMVKTNLIMVVLHVPLLIVLANNIGVLGAAISWALVNLAYVLIVPVLMHRRLLRAESGAWYVDDLIRPVVSGAAAVLVLTVLGSPQGDVALMFFLVGALMIVGTASALAANHVRPAIVDLSRRALRRR